MFSAEQQKIVGEMDDYRIHETVGESDVGQIQTQYPNIEHPELPLIDMHLTE